MKASLRSSSLRLSMMSNTTLKADCGSGGARLRPQHTEAAYKGYAPPAAYLPYTVQEIVCGEFALALARAQAFLVQLAQLRLALL